MITGKLGGAVGADAPPTPSAGAVTLTQRRVYIVPTRSGLAFAGTLLLMLLGSVNYNLGLGYVLTFLLCGLAVVAMLHTWRNLADLTLAAGRATPAFAGDPAVLRVLVQNRSSLARTGIGLAVDATAPTFIDVAPRDSVAGRIAVPTSARGWLRPGRVRVVTTYPLGLFRAWAYAELDLAVLVYPRPERDPPPLPDSSTAEGRGGRDQSGEDDFASVRDYVPGDSPRRVAWKAAARSDALLTKQFSGGDGSSLVWLDLGALPASLDPELALSRLAAWVIEADALGRRYGLRLTETALGPDSGPSHRDRCLQALALHGRH